MTGLSPAYARSSATAAPPFPRRLAPPHLLSYPPPPTYVAQPCSQCRQARCHPSIENSLDPNSERRRTVTIFARRRSWGRCGRGPVGLSSLPSASPASRTCTCPRRLRRPAFRPSCSRCLIGLPCTTPRKNFCARRLGRRRFGPDIARTLACAADCIHSIQDLIQDARSPGSSNSLTLAASDQTIAKTHTGASLIEHGFAYAWRSRHSANATWHCHALLHRKHGATNPSNCIVEEQNLPSQLSCFIGLLRCAYYVVRLVFV